MLHPVQRPNTQVPFFVQFSSLVTFVCSRLKFQWPPIMKKTSVWRLVIQTTSSCPRDSPARGPLADQRKRWKLILAQAIFYIILYLYFFKTDIGTNAVVPINGILNNVQLSYLNFGHHWQVLTVNDPIMNAGGLHTFLISSKNLLYLHVAPT